MRADAVCGILITEVLQGMSSVTRGSGGKKRGVARRRRPGAQRLWFLYGLGILAALGVAGVKVAQPYIAAQRQAERTNELRRKIQLRRSNNADLRANVERVQKDAGAEAAAREQGWRRREEVPADLKTQPPKEAVPAKPQDSGDQ